MPDSSVSEPDSSKSKTKNPMQEVRLYFDHEAQRKRILPIAALIGLLAGAGASLFRFSLTYADKLRNMMLTWAHQYPYGWIFALLYSAIFATIAVWIVAKWAPEASGSGIPHLEGTLKGINQLNGKKILPVKFISGLFALGSGLVLGREGPSVHIGGAIAEWSSQIFHPSPQERRTLISAGAGAGLAAAFNAPISGLIFVLEELRRDFKPIVFTAAFIATIISSSIVQITLGQEPVYTVPEYSILPLNFLPLFLILGILAGIVGVLFNKGLLFSVKTFEKLCFRNRLFITVILGLMIGFIAWKNPALVGGGHKLSEEALTGKMLLTVIPGVLILRLILTWLSYSIGAAGGIFAPLLVLGALLGLGFARVVEVFAPEFIAEPGVFAVVGMAALFAGIVRAPLTGIMLIIEMTGNFKLMLPLLFACFAAYITADTMKDLPVYEALLLSGMKGPGYQEEGSLIEIAIEEGSAFEGKLVSELRLNKSCLLVNISNAGVEQIPNANTRLVAGSVITVLLNKTDSASKNQIMSGCSKNNQAF